VWDDLIPENLQNEFMAWLSNVFIRFEIPRTYSKLSMQAAEKQLHLFCDASEEAYAVCAYLLLKEGGESEVSLIMSKSRVKPLKVLSVPRLELMGAVIATRILTLSDII
jgi:hypothetical protein